ncbi:Zn-dependent hydrolase [Actinoplanes sp. NBRC 14428]|uniref:N-carbamoyl-L-amino-acid hydrolase n=1 Tax=Pseudosporangium ferrugineum TaxID=439699 RepID=A0A2T0RF07_9ACTN|nr:allantoate amidohydrolase [Pseudosporangium ferrugineum]PRY19745.1 N-carbamoyl-L-amino-acid hydrolase [Pseudosporangium ferrugineum]BCJ51964.1 Zn-dependent hydrolase [Actinoplanes sp. NBRC 14428]
MTAAFQRLWQEIATIGRDPRGGYLRYALSEPELVLRDWFRNQAARRDLAVTEDGNGNLFAWWGRPWGPDAVLTGSHFDSVPHGGGYDGPLGIVSAFLAVDALRERGVTPGRPIGIAAFVEEEGGRFGVPCLGSRLLTGAITPEKAAGLCDRDGVTFGEALGARPAGALPGLARRVSAVVELHIEQGKALVDLGAPVGVASAIWPHGRWRMDFTGTGDHAGTTRMADRHDPMLTFAHTVLAANEEARAAGAHATVARVEVEPNATNAIPSLVRGWLDARAADTPTLDRLVEAVLKRATEQAGRDGTGVVVEPESLSPEVAFDTALAARLAGILGGAPILPTSAGHDAGVLSAHVPTAMLFVRNPTGVSHSPAEHAPDEDCAAGAESLATVLEALT